nr:unnamed protein product [Digitaria exilis]
MSGELMQTDEGIHPLKLLLLALSATKFLPPAEMIEADVKRDYTAGAHQLIGQWTSECVAGQVEAQHAMKVT